jgi:hypothetical protein
MIPLTDSKTLRQRLEDEYDLLLRSASNCTLVALEERCRRINILSLKILNNYYGT